MIKFYINILLLGICCTILRAEIVFNAANVSHPFFGFGAQVWPGDLRVEALSENLNLKYFRIAPGGCPTPPTDANITQMDAYVDSQYNGTNRGNSVTTSLQIAESLDITVIFIRFGGPAAWLGTDNILLSQYFDDYARLWASEIYFFKSRGLRVDYVELFNEPEGNWNVKVPAESYNTFVKLVRAELNNRGLTDVGIVGPGLAYLYYGTSWIGALDTDGKNALAAWSTHAWDEGWGHTDALPSYLGQRWQDYFGAAVNSADPCHLKPIIVTEYASGVRTYNGVTYDVNTYGDTSQFAERCYENSLTLANNGANVLCYWEAANQSWQSQPMYAFLRINSTLRPTYYVMSTLMPYIPDNAMVLTKTWNDPNISAAGFVGSGKLVLAFANSGATTINRTISVSGVTSLNVNSILAFQSGAVIDKTSDFSYDFETSGMEISLPPESTLTVIADVNQCGAMEFGDLNDDCKVTFADFAGVASDWLDDNNYQYEITVINDFESYELPPDFVALQAEWIPTPNLTVTLDTSEFHGGSRSMKYTGSTWNSPWYLKAEYRLPGIVWGSSGQDWTGTTTFSIWVKPTASKGCFKISLVDCYGDNAYLMNWGVLPTGSWINLTWDLTGLDAYGGTLTDSEMTRIGRIDIVAKKETAFAPASQDGTNTYYIDDITRMGGSSGCSGIPTGDITGDCVVDFKDVKVISENWLECFLVEQSACW